jgi:hypothetical protein
LEAASGPDESPLGPLLRAAEVPRGHWLLRLPLQDLTKQGKDASGGAYDYIIGKRMRSGFASIAWPVRYGDTGVMTSW